MKNELTKNNEQYHKMYLKFLHGEITEDQWRKFCIELQEAIFKLKIDVD